MMLAGLNINRTSMKITTFTQKSFRATWNSVASDTNDVGRKRELCEWSMFCLLSSIQPQLNNKKGHFEVLGTRGRHRLFGG
jgi:hypothetical protein